MSIKIRGCEIELAARKSFEWEAPKPILFISYLSKNSSFVLFLLRIQSEMALQFVKQNQLRGLQSETTLTFFSLLRNLELPGTGSVSLIFPFCFFFLNKPSNKYYYLPKKNQFFMLFTLYWTVCCALKHCCWCCCFSWKLILVRWVSGQIPGRRGSFRSYATAKPEKIIPIKK